MLNPARFGGAALLALLLLPVVAPAGEPYEQFLRGLRARGYYDVAIEYLDQVEKSPTTPADIRETLPYERAQTYQQRASTLVSLEERRLQLDRAEQELSRFVEASPNHPLTSRANYDRARILLGRAQVDIWDAVASEQDSVREERRSRARTYLTQAQAIVTQAIQQNQQEVKAFPTFIPESAKARRIARDEALNRLMESQLAAAEISYWRAQSFDPASPERRPALEQAMKEFEGIVQQYRGASAGTYAELWQGKCYEELGDITKALPIFAHVLAISESESENQGTVQVLKDLALRFRLICLNNDQRKDYSIVVEEADAWLKAHRDRAATDIGLGIQWELARALETLGGDRTRTDAQRRGDQNAALERAREISRFGGEYKSNATRMVQRLMLALDRKGGDARDFASAYAAATAAMDESRQLSERYRAALAQGDAAAAAEAQRAIKGAGDQMARLFSQAIQLKGRNTEPDKVVSARLQLGYAYFLQGKYLDCAALAEHELRQQKTAFPELSREAGFLAMSALEAEIATSNGNHALESAWLERLGDRLISTWPTSDRAQEARMLLGRAAWNTDDFLNASRWWSEVPIGTAQFPAAQISTGQAYWRQYVRALQAPDADRPQAEKLLDWKQKAVQFLENGIEQRQRALTDGSSTPDDLVLGKITLAQLRNLDGQFRSQGASRGSIEILTEGPHDVISAVRAPANGDRPRDSGRAQSAQVASLAYQQLLRSYIGVQDLEAASEVRADLEELSGGANPEALTAIYVEFGRELQRELDRLIASGEPDRAAETRRGFEEFLTSLTKRTDGQSFSSLLWIAETLAGLAEGSGADGRPDPDGFRKSARIYEQMLARAEEPGFLPDPAYRQLLQLHLARNLRREGEFAAAEKIIETLLTANPTAPDVQAEAAHLYSDWGVAETADGESQLKLAISGRRGRGPDIWGWTATVNRLQKEMATRPSDPLQRMLIDARYNLAATEFTLAKRIQDDAERERRLSLARHAIFSFIRSTPQIEHSDHARFDALYGQVLAEQGEPVRPLPRDPKELASEKPPARPTDPIKPLEQPAVAATASRPATRTSMLLVWSLVAVGLLAAGGILSMMMRQVSRKRERIMELGRAAAPPNRKGVTSRD